MPESDIASQGAGHAERLTTPEPTGEIGEGQGQGARPKTSPASRPEVKTEAGTTAAPPEEKGEDLGKLAEVLRKVIPRDSREGERAIVPLKISGEGISRTMGETDSGIQTHFDTSDPNKWTWRYFMLLRGLAPTRKGSGGHVYLPCTMPLKRDSTQT